MVKALVEERLKVQGKIPENYDNLSNGGEEKSLPSPQQNKQQKSVNSPTLFGETPGKDTGVKRTLAEKFDKDTWVKRTLAEDFGKDTGVKRTLAEEFGSVAKATDLDFGSSEEEGSKDLENKATLTTIQNTQQKSVSCPALFGETPSKDTEVKRTLAEKFDKDTGVRRTLAEEFGKDTGVKRTLAEEFGSVAKATDLDFVYVSPPKATKDDKDAKVPAYGRGCRGRRTVKDEDAADKKKVV
ncbi:hypothetical protein F2Q69_00040641 [Brassica cretica]|uniref:Uncharacterized protein n=1 Tax=Brassica cretica TaxID=69181 RepID=A0A8S9NDI0_BRACR|nr:hypothetical protein F2Q69_00040641 [Brassica cretica]